MQNRVAVLLFLFFLTTTLSSFSTLGNSSLSLVTAKSFKVKDDRLLIGADSLKNKITATNATAVISNAAAAITNPIIKYAQLPYAGQVSICPNDGKELPKLFLCGGNDSRLIETGITDAQSITWERFISGGSCITVSNSDCANDNASASCWAQVATGKDYLANSAGQFRVRIVDSTGTPYVFYFNVYQNTLVPTAVAKNDIVKYGTSCKIDGKITVGGFGSGYEYSFTTGSTPGTWQDSNVFTTGTAGTYTAFVRIKGVVGSCEFKVINLEIKSLDFAVTTSITSPKCNGGLGSVQVITNDVKQQYVYKIFNSANVLVSSSGTTDNPNYPFTDLSSDTYKIETSVVGSACMVDTQTGIIIKTAPSALTSGASITTALTPCSTGRITITKNGGTGPYKYYVNIDGAGFVENPTNVIIVDKSGNYVIRVEDVNGCSASDTSVTVPVVDKPTYTIGKVDGNCTGSLGSITINVSDNKGYTVGYSIDNGGTYQSGTVTGTTESRVYPNLAPGNYSVIVRYKKSGVNSNKNCYDPVEIITIGASTALTASAGVAELSGCGIAPNELQGKVRITNPQGGMPFAAPNLYRYSFDDKATWITSNEAYVNPGGPYTFYIKDASGCEYAMGGIILDPKPAAPTISVNAPVFNCDGSATSTVTVTNSGSGDPKFSYDYYIDGVLNTNTPSNIFKNVTQGDHTITVNYNVLSVSTYSNLLQEDFGKGGFTTTPGINPAYCFEDEATTHLLPGYTCNKDEWINDGEYAVASTIRTEFGGSWNVANDHTLPDDPLGRFLCVNVGGTAGIGGILYSKPIKDVIPNQPVIISLWAENLMRSIRTTYHDPKLTIELVNNLNGVGGTETIVATSDPSVGHTNPWQVPKSDKWEYKELSLNPGTYSNLSFVVRSYSNEFNGNDVLIDDIWVRQIPRSCNTMAAFPVIVDGSKAFSAGITGYKDVLCSGQQNGQITLSAKNFDAVKGFQYSVDGGTWITVIPSPASTSGSVTLTNLPSKIYNIRIRYDNTANSCTFPLAQEIKNPTALEISATVTQVATCTTGATITAEAKFGTPGYQYELRAANGVTVIAGYEFSSNAIFTNVPIGKYTVVAKDLNLCQSSVSALVDVVAAIKPTASFDPSSLCFDPTTGANIVVRVTNGVGPYTYTTTYNGGTPSASSPSFAGPTFTYNAAVAGTYVFEVTDSFGCIADPITQIISTSLTTVTPVTTSLDCDVAPADNRAVITGTISGGKSPFVVTLLSGNATGTLVQPTAVATANERIFTYSIAVAGPYSFQIKDANNCITTSSATINPLTPITLGSTNVNPKCNTSSDGTIQLNPGGGSGGFTYSTDGIAYNSTSFFTGLSAGTPYTYYVKDSNKCTKSITVTLTAPAVINGTATITTPYTCASSATITVGAVVNGGNGVYQYTLNRGGLAVTSAQNSKIFNNISVAGNYTVTITDSNGCSFTTTPVMVIDALNPPLNPTFSERPISCKATELTSDVTVSVTAGTGTGTLQYETIAPSQIIKPQQGSSILTGLTPGSYTIKVTDSNNCSVTGSYTVKAVVPIIVKATLVNNVKCFGEANGAVNYTISGLGNSVNYSYSIDGGVAVLGTTPATPAVTTFVVNSTGLAAGNHSLVITDLGSNCTGTNTPINVAAPVQLKIDSINPTAITCLVSGGVVINTVGGWGSNSYTITGTAPVVASVTQSTNSFANLTAGDYTATVTDLNGCIVTQNFTIANKVLPTASIGASDFCYDSVDKATLVVSPNIQTNYVYSVNGGATQGTGTFSGLIPGSYTIRVADTSTGCFIDLPAQTITNQVSANTAITKNLDCSASPDATIKVTVGNGYPDYSYRVNTNGGGYSGAPIPLGLGVTTFNYTTTTGAAAATYDFEITDAKGCIVIVTQNISARVSPTATTTPTNPTCFGSTNGSVLINASLGLAPYTYEVSTDGITFTPMTSNLHSGATAGDYWFKVTDFKNCSFTTAKVTLSAPATINGTASITTPYTCASSATITVAAGVTGGNGIYKYTLNRGGVAITSAQDSPIFNNISVAGNYTVTITDSNGCSFTTTPVMVIDALNPPLNPTFSERPISCKATELTSDVTVSVTAGTGTGTLQYETIAPSQIIKPQQGSSILTGLTPGSYTIKVTDSNNCSVTGSYTVKAVVPIIVNATLVNNVKCFGEANGAVNYTISGLGNSVNYSYSIDGGVAVLGTTPATPAVTTFVVNSTGLAAGNHSLVITDLGSNCTGTNTPINVAAPVQLKIDSINPTAITCLVSGGVVINTSGGWGSNSYTITGTAPVVASVTQSTNSFANLTAGDYTATVTDLNGCIVTQNFTIANKVLPTASIGASDFCYDSVDKATLVVSPNIQTNYVYSVNGGATQGTGTFSGLIPGSYTIRVADTSTGCFIDLPAQTITNQVSANTAITKNLDCSASPDATIKVTVGNGYPDYSYRVNTNGGGYSGAPIPLGLGVTTFNYTTTTGAAAATYDFEITDAKGCIVIVTQNISARVSPTATTTPTNPTCFGSTNGSVLINASLGLAPYTYEVSTDGITFAQWLQIYIQMHQQEIIGLKLQILKIVHLQLQKLHYPHLRLSTERLQ